jgi:hypothetical protein
MRNQLSGRRDQHPSLGRCDTRAEVDDLRFTDDSTGLTGHRTHEIDFQLERRVPRFRRELALHSAAHRRVEQRCCKSAMYDPDRVVVHLIGVYGE